MRVTGGSLKGQRIDAPAGHAVRPTSDKVRQAIFNMIGSRINIHGANVLDVFSGSGALGFESLSRGASSCTFIEKDARTLQGVKDNAARLNCLPAANFLKKDSTALPLRTNVPPFDLVFLDPPYGRGLVCRALEKLKAGWIGPESLLVIETEKGEMLQTPLNIVQQKVYGAPQITLAYIIPE